MSLIQTALSKIRKVYDDVQQSSYGRVATQAQQTIQLQPFRQPAQRLIQQAPATPVVGLGRLMQKTPQFNLPDTQFTRAAQIAVPALQLPSFVKSYGRDVEALGQTFQRPGSYLQRPNISLSEPSKASIALDLLPFMGGLKVKGGSKAILDAEKLKLPLKKTTPLSVKTAVGESGKPIQTVSPKSPLATEAKGKKIKLSTGVEVPRVEDLSEGELNYLGMKPIEEGMPKDLKDYIKAAQDRFHGVKATNKVKASPLQAEATKYKSAEARLNIIDEPVYNEPSYISKLKDPLAKDTQRRIVAGQDMVDEIKSAKLPKSLNKDGTITVFHGTSNNAANSISKSGKFATESYFSPLKNASAFGSEGAEQYVKNKFGNKGQVLEIKVDARDVNFNSGTGEIEAADGLVRGFDNIWRNPKRYTQAKGGVPEPKLTSVSMEGGKVRLRTKGIEAAPKNRILTQQAVKAKNIVGQTTPKVEQPITGGGGQQGNLGGLSSGDIIPPTDPIQKIITALKQSKPLERQQSQIYAKIRSQQAGAIAGVGQNVPGEAGFHAQLSKLKGGMPKVEFESIRKQIKQPDIDSLFNKVEQSNILTPFEKISAKSGLAKLLGAEGGSVPVKSELSLLNEVFPPDFIQAVLNKRPLMSKLFAIGEEALNLPRAVMATADLSAPLRQGVFLIGRPKQFLPALRDQFKYFASEKAYQGLAKDIQARPTYKLMRENKLALTDLSPLMKNREEVFMSNLAEKIPGFGSLAKASNRAYSGFLNKLRADVFDDLYKTAQSQGLVKSSPGVVADIAKFVNAATGRGTLGALEAVAPVLNGALFSPRLMASRLNLLNPAFYVKLDPFVRKEALKSLFTFAGTGLTVLTLAKLNGVEVGTDPRSSDFGKMKIGNTRLDIWGGFQQYIRAAGQLISGQYVSSTTGKEYTLGEGYKPLTRLGILGRVIESKEAPVLSFISTLLTGQNSLGGKLDVPVEIINRFIPMMISGFYDLQKEGGLKEMGLGLPSIFGVGVQTYGKQVPNLETTPSGKPTIKLNPVPGIAEDIMGKIRGKPASNIPQAQQQPIAETIQAEKQAKINKDKLKQQLESGQVVTPQDNIDLETAKLMFEYSPDQVKQVGDTLLYKDGNTIKTLETKWTEPTLPEVSGTDAFSKAQISNYKSDITARQGDVMKLYDLKQMDYKQAMDEYLRLDELKKSATLKVTAPKKITIKKVSLPKSKSLKLKAMKIKKVSLRSKPLKKVKFRSKL